jgi:hypothetical protein
MQVYMYGYMLWVFALYVFTGYVKAAHVYGWYRHVCVSYTKKNRWVSEY